MYFSKSFFDNRPIVIGEYDSEAREDNRYIVRAKRARIGRSTKFNSIVPKTVNLKQRTLSSPILRKLTEPEPFRTLIYEPTLVKYLKEDTNPLMEPNDLKMERYRIELISQLAEDDSEFSGYMSRTDLSIEQRKRVMIERLGFILRGIISKQYSQLKQQKIELNREDRLATLAPRATNGSTRIQYKTWFANGRNMGGTKRTQWVPLVETESERHPEEGYGSLMM